MKIKSLALKLTALFNCPIFMFSVRLGLPKVSKYSSEDCSSEFFYQSCPLLTSDSLKVIKQ